MSPALRRPTGDRGLGRTMATPGICIQLRREKAGATMVFPLYTRSANQHGVDHDRRERSAHQRCNRSMYVASATDMKSAPSLTGMYSDS